MSAAAASRRVIAPLRAAGGYLAGLYLALSLPLAAHALEPASGDAQLSANPSGPTKAALDLVFGGEPAAYAARGIRHVPLGEIDLPGGRVLAADGLVVFAGTRPFVQTVAPGNYPVGLYVLDSGRMGSRVALAELRFAEGRVARWSNATTEGQNFADLDEDEFFGYGVDAGIGAFMAPEALVAYLDDMAKAKRDIPGFSDFYTNVLAETLEKTEPNAMIYQTGSLAQHKVALFHSGWGDGIYPSYFGYGADGKPLALVTTFFVIEEN